jgi:hypothetical protein
MKYIKNWYTALRHPIIGKPDLEKGITNKYSNLEPSKAAKSIYDSVVSFSDVPLFHKFNIYKYLGGNR